MRNRLAARRPSPALVVALIALSISLGGTGGTDRPHGRGAEEPGAFGHVDVALPRPSYQRRC